MAARTSRPHPSRRLLLVEDHEDTRSLLVEHLTELGYEVEQAVNGNEAIAAALRTPDVIVLDLALPVLDGVDTLAVLRSYPATMAIPVVVYTANVQMLKRRSLRYDAVVEKPCTPDELERVIDMVLRTAVG